MRTIVFSFIISATCLSALTLGGCSENTSHEGMEGFPFKSANAKGWGLMDLSGKRMVSDGTYVACPSAVVNGMFTVPEVGGTVGLYNVNNPMHAVSSGQYLRIGYFFDPVTVAQVEKGSPLCLINKQGDVVAMLDYYPDYRIVMAHNFSEGLALVGTDEGKFGFVDTSGKLVVPPVYDFAADFSEGKALVGKADAEGKLGFFVIGSDGNLLTTLKLVWYAFDTAFGNGRLTCRFPSGGCGALNEKGKVYFALPDSILSLSRFQQGLAVVSARFGVGLVDKNGQEVLPCQYNQIEVLNEHRLALKAENNWMLTDENGKKIKDLDGCPLFFSEQGGLISAEGHMALARTDGSVIAWMDSVKVTPQALRQKPEVFVRTLATQNGQKDTVALKSINEVQTLKEQVQPSAQKHDAYIEQTDWKRVAKNHPFYKEAAKMLSSNIQEDDANSRRMILNYVEHLRTSYTTKDIDFLNQLFSDDALIVVGHVVKVAPRTKENQILQDQVAFSVKTKKEYLSRLEKVFQSNKEIKLKFSDFHISRHPSMKGIYGVTLHQQYKSDRYSDDGWLFLLWDFRDKDAPQIHVRTWQPGFLNDKTPLPEGDVISIGDFNLR